MKGTIISKKEIGKQILCDNELKLSKREKERIEIDKSIDRSFEDIVNGRITEC